jgi:hypothetical protein
MHCILVHYKKRQDLPTHKELGSSMVPYNLVLKLYIKPNKKIMFAIENQEIVLEYLYKTKAA